MFSLSFETRNDAFKGPIPQAQAEMARILRETARKIEAGRIQGLIYDLNGNPVGTYKTGGSSK